MRKVHRIVGITMLLVFLGTGVFMHVLYVHLRGMGDTQRMLFRSDHIYLMLSAVVNLMLGLYMTRAVGPVQRILQTIGSAVILAAPFVLLVAFFTEPWMRDLERPWTRLAIYSMFGGGLAHLLAALIPLPPGEGGA